jgi:hypothetical protein
MSYLEIALTYLEQKRRATTEQGTTTEAPGSSSCGSPKCAGCYDVGDGRKIHPPRCGEDFLRWRAWMEGKGKRH